MIFLAALLAMYSSLYPPLCLGCEAVRGKGGQKVTVVPEVEVRKGQLKDDLSYSKEP